jgi:putative DNA primase/helicase
MTAAAAPAVLDHGRGSALRRVEDALERHGCGPGRNGAWKCPAHNDRNPSLSLSQGEVGALIHCHSGCDLGAILEALGLEKRDLFDAPEDRERTRIVTTYDYTSESGELLHQVVRFEPKGFRQRRPDGAGGWIWNVQGVQLVPYHLPEIIAAVAADDPIVICEGEKDADRVRSLGLAATCNPMGAGKWRDEYAEYFRGATDVRVVADRDEPGRKHATAIARSLRAVGATVRVLEPIVGKDVSDHLDAGRTLAELVEIEPDRRDEDGDRDGADRDHDSPPPTDTGNAERLVRLFGQDLRHVHLWSKWLAWDGRCFAIDQTGEIDRRAKDTVRAMYEDAAKLEDPEERKKLAIWARKSESAARRDAMIQLARSEPGIPVCHEQLDADPWVLNVMNGTVDLRTGELRPHRRTDLITKLAPVIYDRDATAPTWAGFLERVLPDPGVRSFVQRAAGYSLTGQTGEQVLFLLWGGGANGKSTFIETAMALLGDYALKTPAETLLAKRDTGIPNDVAALRGARFVAAVESEEGRRLAEVRVKELTGGDTIAARFMRAEWFTFRPVCKLWLATNHKPQVRGTDLAIWRRIRLIPFTVTIPETERNPGLPEKLVAELPGILAWAVEGCLEWQAKGLEPPQAVLAATNEYRAEQDILRAFLDDRCAFGSACEVTSAALYRAYREWAETVGEKPITQKALAAMLSERAFEQVRIGHQRTRGWRGLGLLDRQATP